MMNRNIWPVLRKKAKTRVNQLICLLIRESRSGEIEKAVMDPVYQDQLFQNSTSDLTHSGDAEKTGAACL